MSFLPKAHTATQGEHIALGHHPETHDQLFVSTVDRQSGLYIDGTQGSGKTGLIKNMVAQDMAAGNGIIVLDAHGDLTNDIIAQAPEDKLDKISLLDMTDEHYPFGANLFAISQLSNAVAQAQSADRIIHVFETLWPEISSQQYLPRFLRACILTLLSTPSSNLVDMYRLLTDDDFRQQLLKNVTDQTIHSFWQFQYDDLAISARMQRVGPLVGRLEAILMGRPIIRNILGQRQTTVNFREVIERREILLIKLPVKTLAQDARLLGTILVSLIHSAIFSFADVPLEQRPGVSFYVDEFQNFATPDFGEFFTEARKYKVMLTIAHQYRNQLPAYLQDSTMTARTKVVFQVTPDDAKELAHLFPSSQATVRSEDINPHAVDHLLNYGADNWAAQAFIDVYLRPLQTQKKGGTVEIKRPGTRWEHWLYWLTNTQPPTDNPKVADPTPYLNHLLYEVMRTGNANLSLPYDVVIGFSNFGDFYQNFRYSWKKAQFLASDVQFPPYLVVQDTKGNLRWTRQPETAQEALYCFIFFLRQMMTHLASEPIGKKSTLSTTEVAHMLTQLPRRAAFIRSGEETGVIYTNDTPPSVDASTLRKRLELIQVRTRQQYCKPKEQVERELGQQSAPATDTTSADQTSNGPAEQSRPSRWEEV